jgi:hypothetical protein
MMFCIEFTVPKIMILYLVNLRGFIKNICIVWYCEFVQNVQTGFCFGAHPISN